MNKRFYLACMRDNVGGNVAFHCKDGRGYSTNIAKAHSYTKEEAQSAWDRGREFDLPLNADMVDALSELKVDCQYIGTDTELEPGCEKYFAYRKGKWSGNDVYWIDELGQLSLFFKTAATFTAKQASEGPDDLCFLPHHKAMKASRLTFSSNLINKRKMIQSSGLITPEHIKRNRRRVNNPKTRWNCPGCGRITWQYNPYDFAGCQNINCSEWSMH